MYIDLVTIDLCPGQGGGGIKPSGVLDISNNGVFDVYSYASANVNVPTTGFDEREVTEGKLNIVNLNNSASFVKNYVFDTNSYVQTVNLPDCYEVKNNAFISCSSLSQVNLPMCIRIDSAAFRNCSSLSQVNLPMVKTIGQSVFGACSALSSLTLCTDVYWTIPFGTRTYGGTPIVNESSSASIYVRSDTYSLWISSQLWSSISSKFVSVPVSGPALSFSNGLLSGTTKAIASDFTSYLSVSKSDITGVLLPECRYIDNQTFQNCSSLTRVSLPECRYIGNQTFQDCSSLTQVSLPECRYIGNQTFQNCSSLTQVSLPECRYIGIQTFQNCSSLTRVSLPMCSHIDDEAFWGCGFLSDISLPLCEYIGYCALLACSFTQVNLPMCSYIGSKAFWNCVYLSSITIGYSGVCSLSYEGFVYTPIADGTGSIYVPASLVDAYKSAPNWSQFSSQIFPIS